MYEIEVDGRVQIDQHFGKNGEGLGGVVVYSGQILPRLVFGAVYSAYHVVSFLPDEVG